MRVTMFAAMGLLFSAISTQVLADEFETLFKKKYKEENLPELRLSMTDRLKAKGLNQKQIEKEMATAAEKGANCRFKVFQAYGKKYRQVAHKAMLDGASTEDATFEVTDALSQAVADGKLPQREYSRRMIKAMELYNACVLKNKLIHR